MSSFRHFLCSTAGGGLARCAREVPACFCHLALAHSPDLKPRGLCLRSTSHALLTNGEPAP